MYNKLQKVVLYKTKNFIKTNDIFCECQETASAAELTRPRQRSERRNRSSSARPPEE